MCLRCELIFLFNYLRVGNKSVRFKVLPNNIRGFNANDVAQRIGNLK